MHAYEISDDKARLDTDLIHGFLKGSYWSPGVPRAIVERLTGESLEPRRAVKDTEPHRVDLVSVVAISIQKMLDRTRHILFHDKKRIVGRCQLTVLANLGCELADRACQWMVTRPQFERCP